MTHSVSGVTRRRLLAPALGAAAGAAVVACAAPGPAADGPAAPAALAGSIEFWQWGVTYVEGFDKLAATFNERHGAGARVNHSRPEGYDDKIKVTVAAGSGGP